MLAFERDLVFAGRPRCPRLALPLAAWLWLVSGCLAQSGVTAADGSLLGAQEETPAATAPTGGQTQGLSDGTAGDGVPSAGGEPAAIATPVVNANAVVTLPVVPVAAPTYALVGRFDQTDPNKPRMAWAGSRIGLRFSGTSLGVLMTDTAYDAFDVSIDGVDYAAPSNQFALPNAAPVACLPTAQVPAFDGKNFPGCLLLNLSPNVAVPTLYPVVAGLPAGEHVAWLTKRTEFALGRVGRVQLHGVVLDAGASLLSPPAVLPRRIEVVGDSSTVGYGAAQPAVCSYNERNSSAPRSLAAALGNFLHADVVNLSNSGQGVYYSFFDHNLDHTLPTTYRQLLPFELPPYNFALDHVDAVVLSAGGDDLWGDNGNGTFMKADPNSTVPARTSFVSAYVNFLADIRSKRKDASIICTVNFHAYNQDMITLRSALQEAVGARTAAGDANVVYFEFFPPNNPAVNPEGFGNIFDARTRYNLPYGCDGHIQEGTAQFLARRLGPIVAKQLGWTDAGP